LVVLEIVVVLEAEVQNLWKHCLFEEEGGNMFFVVGLEASTLVED
jgi:hypothetical protein